MTARLELRGLRSAVAGPFDLALPPGACLAVAGPSGAGKSVFLRMIADFDPHHGEAFLDGQARSGMSAPEWRRQVVYNAAEAGWWLERVGDHFAEPPTDLAARLGLRPDIVDAPVRLCSTGERQRLALLRAISTRPPVLLLDEPTASLDTDSVGRVEALLRELLGAGVSMIVVTHDPAQAGRLGTARRMRIEQGRPVPA